MPAVLVLCTSSVGPVAGAPTGCWCEEVAAPYYAWREAGFNVTLASVAGGAIPWDAASTSGDFLTPDADKFMKDAEARALCAATPAAKDVLAGGIDKYDAIFLPGGHGAVIDVAVNDDVKALLEAFWAAGKVCSAVCHGPVGFNRAVDAQGAPIVKGRRATGFTNSEEEAVGKTAAVPFLLESRLVELGARFEAAGDWASHVVVDGKLVTGQNPQSSRAVADAVAALLAPQAAS